MFSERETGKRLWRAAGKPVALMLCALLTSCDGFFVDPVLTGVTVGPTATIQDGTTVQMTAVGTYNDGSQHTISSGIYWSSGTPSVAAINSSGLVTGMEPGDSTITASVQTVTGSATVTVTIVGLTAIKVTSSDGLTNIPYGSSEQFVATGSANGTQVNITDSVTWSTSPAQIPSVSIDPTTGLLTTNSGSSSAVQFQVIATDPTTGIFGSMNFTVHP